VEEAARKLLSTIQASDSVELKLTVPETDQRSTIAALGIDPMSAQIRQVYFLDTPDLKLNKAGVVVRARRVQGRDGDTVVKLRPVEPQELSKKLRRAPGFGVEVDAMPGGWVCSGSYKGVTSNDDVARAVAGGLPTRKLFSKEQRAFYQDRTAGDIDIDELTFLGPLFVLKARWKPRDLARSMVAEMWFYPDGSRLLELSTKCHPGEGFQVAAKARAFLTERGISLTGEQETKTRRALSLFAKAQQTNVG
jgi:hypothetical protein